MKNVSLFRAIVSCVIGIVVGVIVAALVNMLNPATDLAWTLLPICLAAAVSGFAGYLIGAKQKR